MDKRQACRCSYGCIWSRAITFGFSNPEMRNQRYEIHFHRRSFLLFYSYFSITGNRAVKRTHKVADTETGTTESQNLRPYGAKKWKTRETTSSIRYTDRQSDNSCCDPTIQSTCYYYRRKDRYSAKTKNVWAGTRLWDATWRDYGET